MSADRTIANFLRIAAEDLAGARLLVGALGRVNVVQHHTDVRLGWGWR